MSTNLRFQIDPPDRFDLACIGSSLSGFYAITLDAIRHIQVARRVFTYALNQDHLSFLRGFNEDVVDLNRVLYLDGAACADAYRNIIDLVLSEAHQGWVAYVSQGSPAFQTYTALELVRRAADNGLIARIYPGVSSFECLLTALGASQSFDNIQIYTCQAIAAGKARIDPMTPCFIFNLSVYAAKIVNTSGAHIRRDMVEKFVSSLAKLYPPKHPVSLMHLEPEGCLSIGVSTISHLDKDLVKARPGTTIHIDGL